MYFHKPFDSNRNGLINARINLRYSAHIKNIYQKATMHVKMDKDTRTVKINLNWEVRQGDTISPKLFTLGLEDIFKIL